VWGGEIGVVMRELAVVNFLWWEAGGVAHGPLVVSSQSIRYLDVIRYSDSLCHMSDGISRTNSRRTIVDFPRTSCMTK
jgi:hypothetical protein